MSLADILAAAGLAVAILAIPIGYYLAKWLDKRRVSSYIIRDIALLDPQEGIVPSQVEISFSGRRIRNLRRVDCVIWNSGKKPIHFSDVRSEKGIAISLPEDHEILDYPYKMSRKENKVRVDKDKDSLSCRFDYLDAGEGINLGILYTGSAA